jgi:hypothetical protein
VSLFEAVVVTFNAICESVGGPLIVALFYWFRFHSLKGTRSYTTYAFFYFGLLCFILPFIFLYYLLSLKLSALAAVWVLILVWLFPVLPSAWREFCHRIARIPTYAHQLRDILETAPFELRDEDLPAVRRKLARFGYQLDDFRAVQSTAIQARFLKIAAIMHHLEEWEEKHQTFMRRNGEQYSALLHAFDMLCFKGVRAMKNVAGIHLAIMDDGAASTAQPDDWNALDSQLAKCPPKSRLQAAAVTVTGTMLEDLRKDLDFFLERVLLFVVRGVLTNESSFSSRRDRLNEIGFTIIGPPPSIMPAVATAVSITVVWSLIWFIFLGDIILPGERAIAFTRGVVLPTLNLIVNFWLVFYVKRNFAFANEGIFGGFPIVFVLTIGLVTALLIFPVRAFFDYYQFWGSDKAYSWVLLHNLPLSLFPWVTGALTALLAQESIWSKVSSTSAKRALDGVVFGIGMTAVVVLIFVIDRFFPIAQMESLRLASGGIIPMIVLSSFAFGFAIGFSVIAPIREGSSLRGLAYDDMNQGRVFARA